MYSGEDNKPVILEENIDLIKKADNYFKAFDYYSAGNNIRKAIEKKLKFLLPETVRITTTDLEDELRQLFKYYDENKYPELISIELRKQLIHYKDIVFNPSSHYDLKSPFYKSEIEKAFEIYKILNEIPKLKIHLIAGLRASLFYKNIDKNYSAEYMLLENLYAIRIPANHLIRINNPKHRLIHYQKDGIDFLDPVTGISKLEPEIEVQKNEVIRFSKRIEKITDFINPNAEIKFEEFVLSDNKSIEEICQKIINP